MCSGARRGSHRRAAPHGLPLVLTPQHLRMCVLRHIIAIVAVEQGCKDQKGLVQEQQWSSGCSGCYIPKPTCERLLMENKKATRGKAAAA
mgnify:CR=1 FL=1